MRLCLAVLGCRIVASDSRGAEYFADPNKGAAGNP